MIVTIEVDKEAYENVVNKIQAKKSEIETSMSYDERLRKDIINDRFFDGRVAVEKDYIEFCGNVMGMLSKCVMN